MKRYGVCPSTGAAAAVDPAGRRQQQRMRAAPRCQRTYAAQHRCIQYTQVTVEISQRDVTHICCWGLARHQHDTVAIRLTSPVCLHGTQQQTHHQHHDTVAITLTSPVCLHGAQQQTRRLPVLLWINGTESQTNTRPLHRHCLAHYADNIKNLHVLFTHIKHSNYTQYLHRLNIVITRTLEQSTQSISLCALHTGVNLLLPHSIFSPALSVNMTIFSITKCLTFTQ